MYDLPWKNVLSPVNKCIICLEQMYHLTSTNVLSPWTNVLSHFNKCIISLEQMYHLTSTNVLSALNKCIISLQQMYCLLWTNVSSHFNKCIISCEQMYYLLWTNVSSTNVLSPVNKCIISCEQMYHLTSTNVLSPMNKCIISCEQMYHLTWTNVLSPYNICIISLQQMYYLPWTNVLSPWTNVLSPLHKIYYLLEQMYFFSSQKKQAFSGSCESCVNYLSRLETCFNFLLICSEVTGCFNPYLILLFTTTPTFANSVDPDQMASEQDLHCLSFSLWIWMKTLYGVIWLADSQKWVWLIKLFSRIRVNTPIIIYHLYLSDKPKKWQHWWVNGLWV